MIPPAAGGITGDAYMHSAEFSAGFHTASFISGGLCVLGGVLAAVTVRNPRRAPTAAPAPQQPFHCAVDAPPQVAAQPVVAAAQS